MNQSSLEYIFYQIWQSFFVWWVNRDIIFLNKRRHNWVIFAIEMKIGLENTQQHVIFCFVVKKIWRRITNNGINFAFFNSSFAFSLQFRFLLCSLCDVGQFIFQQQATNKIIQSR
jgi:hypothetical protein